MTKVTDFFKNKYIAQIDIISGSFWSKCYEFLACILQGGSYKFESKQSAFLSSMFTVWWLVTVHSRGWP